ncbi:MAG: hypothetical protein YFSK_2630 [Candidatus Yanofskyibacterium parasiticum]|nr:MAG: hypothetical protein YFSK_2630 [Candidatus Yanofskybacteria bacterium]
MNKLLDLSTIDKKRIAPTMYLMILKQALRNVFLPAPNRAKTAGAPG